MKTSLVKLTRTVTCDVEVTHPPEWSDEDVKTAVDARQIDIANAAPFWNSQNRTVIAGIEVGGKLPKAGEHEMRPEPVELVDEDLDGDGDE